MELMSRRNNQRCALWRARCVCGGEILVTANSLSYGHTKSCGCLKKGKMVRMKKATDAAKKKMGQQKKTDPYPDDTIWRISSCPDEISMFDELLFRGMLNIAKTTVNKRQRGYLVNDCGQPLTIANIADRLLLEPEAVYQSMMRMKKNKLIEHVEMPEF